MDASKINNISDALLKVGEGLVALSMAISTCQTAGSSSEMPSSSTGPKKRSPRVHSPVSITAELADFIGRNVDEAITRPEAEAAVMDYVRSNNLQDPSDKRKIIPDEDLAKLFNSDTPITVLTLKGAIKHHFLTAS